ncbi:MAG: HD-GYP domain-containing protein [Myxococcota bacterium]
MKWQVEKDMLRSLVGLASVVELRDPYTGGHLWRVGQFSRLLADIIGLDRTGVFLAWIGGALHDLGKIAVPDAILRKPGPLTEQEYGVITTHPAVGRDLLGGHPLRELAVAAVYHHHERVDGSGYPERLAGDEIPLVARIVGLADAFDAMTSARPYRAGRSIRAALDTLKEHRNAQFDAALVGPFCELHEVHDTLVPIVGHSDHGQRLVACPNCGPTIVVTRHFRDGQIAYCRNCGGRFILHRSGDTFAAERAGAAESADHLRPVPELEALEDLVEALPGRRLLHRPGHFFGGGATT